MKAVDLIIQEKANVLAVRTVGEGPYYMLRDNFIRILQIPLEADNARDVLARFQDLEEITAPMK